MNYKFEDFNHDGSKDILLEWAGHGFNAYTLYLFDSSTAKFREVKNFSDYPTAVSVTGIHYDYSYKRNGCGDEAWISDLFFIKNNVAIKAGRMRGDGCGVKDGIYIYKIKKTRKYLLTPCL